jgi:hypothetical protein
VNAPFTSISSFACLFGILDGIVNLLLIWSSAHENHGSTTGTHGPHDHGWASSLNLNWSKSTLHID